MNAREAHFDLTLALAAVLAVTSLISLPASGTKQEEAKSPVLDMHLHALGAADQGPPPVGICIPFAAFPAWDQRKPYPTQFMAMLKNPPCNDPVWSPTTDDELRAQTLGEIERLNVYGVLSGTPERVQRWMKVAPGRFYPGLGFNLRDETLTVERLTRLHAEGKLAVLAEIGNQYSGIAPSDPSMEPFWALAEELDMPVGIHIGPGPPGVAYLGARGYRAKLHSALTLEEVLVKHPKLRVYIMHAGYPMLEDLLAVLYAHPQVHVDTGVIVYTQPRAAFYRYLRAIVEAGFIDRVMFGSDQMVWPGVIEHSIAAIEDASFLTDAQKRAILYHNAARFLRLSKEEIARHHDL